MTWNRFLILCYLFCIGTMSVAQSGPTDGTPRVSSGRRTVNGGATSDSQDPSAISRDLETIKRTHDAWLKANNEVETQFWQKYDLALSSVRSATEDFCGNMNSYKQQIENLCTITPGAKCKTGLLQQWIDAKIAYYQDQLALVKKNSFYVDALFSDADKDKSECLIARDEAQLQLVKHTDQRKRFAAESTKAPADVHLRKALAKLDEIIASDIEAIHTFERCKTEALHQQQNLTKLLDANTQKEKLWSDREQLVVAQGEYYRTHYAMLWTLVLEMCPTLEKF